MMASWSRPTARQTEAGRGYGHGGLAWNPTAADGRAFEKSGRFRKAMGKDQSAYFG